MEKQMDTIKVSDLAITNIKNLQKEYGEGMEGLRFGLSGGGCAGYKYVLEFEEGPEEDDLVFSFDAVRVFVNKEHMERLKNSTIDWVENLMAAGFQIHNPQAKKQCGCGESVDF